MRLTVGCNGLLSLCLSLLPGLPCSAPGLTVETVSSPDDVCSAELIALCPHLQGDTGGEGGRRLTERDKFKTGAVCKLLMQKYEGKSAQATDLQGEFTDTPTRACK